VSCDYWKEKTGTSGQAEGLYLMYCVEKKILKANAFKKSLEVSNPNGGGSNGAPLGWV
jgi:hypothetical protein